MNIVLIFDTGQNQYAQNKREAVPGHGCILLQVTRFLSTNFLIILIKQNL